MPLPHIQEYSWNSPKFQDHYDDAQLSDALHSIADRFFSPAAVAAGERTCLVEPKSDEIQDKIKRISLIIYNCPDRNPPERRRTLEQVWYDCQNFVQEIVLAKALGVPYVLKESINPLDLSTYCYDIEDIKTGYNIEVKRQKGYNMFTYDIDKLRPLAAGTWKNLTHFVVSAYKTEDKDNWYVWPFMVCWAPALFFCGRPGDGRYKKEWWLPTQTNPAIYKYMVENTPERDWREAYEPTRKRKAKEDAASRKGAGVQQSLSGMW